MKKIPKILLASSILSLLIISFAPFVVFAQDAVPDSSGGGDSADVPVTPPATSVQQPASNGAVSNVGNQSVSSVGNQAVQITNPLKYTSIQQIVSALVQAILYIGGIVCALWIIWAGFLFVKARGSETELEEAKKTITHALIGTAIIIGANVILTIVTNTINAIKS